MFQTKVVQKIETHILCSVTFFGKSCRFWNNVENYLELCHPRCVVSNRETNMCMYVCLYVRLNTTELLVEYLIIYINNYMFRP
jgi:hypothetical protein